MEDENQAEKEHGNSGDIPADTPLSVKVSTKTNN
jgi:hypothetical protein